MIFKFRKATPVIWTAAGFAAIILSLISLKYLSAPYVWIFLVWAILSILAAWSVRGHTRIVAFLVNFSVALFTLAASEVYFYAPDIRTLHPETFIINDDMLGEKLIGGVAVRATRNHGSQQIYDVVYTIGAEGLRLAPPLGKAPPEACVLFFGGSFIFGTGVENEQTLPYLVGIRSNGAYRVYNFGVGVYGPHQMLAAIEGGFVEDRLDCQPTHVIYVAIPHHVARANGLTYFARHAPRYELTHEGSVKRSGNFDDEVLAARGTLWGILNQVPEKFSLQLTKSALFRRFFYAEPEQSVVAEHLNLFLAIVKSAESLISRRYPGSEFHVLLWPIHGEKANLYQRIRQGLEGLSIKVHPVVNVLPGYETNSSQYELSPHDRHPNTLAYSLLAYYVTEAILKGEKQNLDAAVREKPVFPLKVSANGRRLVDQNNVPFFVNGDTPWSLVGQVSKEDAEFYLKDCATKGINSLIVTLIESHYGDQAPANYYGVQPFTNPNKLTTPNEAYFAHADWVISQAAKYNIQIILAPLYLGCCDDGWYDVLRDNNSVAEARWFGEWVGRRYRNFPNLMYVWGNDMNPGDVRDKIMAMAEGAKSEDLGHLHTYHASGENSALDQWSASESWLDVNITYTYQPVQIKSLQDYTRSPFLPFFLFESAYENDFLGASALRTRQQAYTAVLSGANGHHYGNNPIWHMNGKQDDDSDAWKNHLEDEGRADLPHVRALFESREWFKLVPDEAHAVVTGGYGSGEDYVPVARTSDGITVMVYLPTQRPITVNLGQVSGGEARGWWFNPRDGSSQLIGVYPTWGSQCFTPPKNADWLLVIDDASKNLPPPGQRN